MTSASKEVQLCQVRPHGPVHGSAHCECCSKEFQGPTRESRLRLNPKKAKVLADLNGTEEEQIAAFCALKNQLAEGRDMIRVPAFVAAPSKGEPRRIEELVLYRDLGTEGRVKSHVSQYMGFDQLQLRLRQIDPHCLQIGRTLYAAGRVLKGDGFKDGNNFFIFGPDVFMLESENPDDHISFEFLEASEYLLTAVGNCVEKIFGSETAIQFRSLFNPSTMPVAIVEAALAHEKGHECTPVRVIPNRDPRVAGLSPLIFDALGELAADAVGAKVLHDVFGSRLSVYTLFYRMLHYARIAFDRDPITGPTLDNDALGGAICWAFMEGKGKLRYRAGKFTVDLNAATEIWSQFLEELTAFLDCLVTIPLDDQDGAAREWIERFVARDDAGNFVWPPTMEIALSRCCGVPLKPLTA